MNAKTMRGTGEFNSLMPFHNHMLVQHWPGKANPADFFSRHPKYRAHAKMKIQPKRLVLKDTILKDSELGSVGLTSQAFPINFGSLSFETNMQLETAKLAQMQREDPVIQAMVKAVQHRTHRCDDGNFDKKTRSLINQALTKHEFKVNNQGVFMLRDHHDSLRHGWIPVLPEGMRLCTLAAAHDSPLGAHASTEKMLSKLRGKFWWPGMESDVKEWTQACHKCQMTKVPRRPTRGDLKSMVAYEPFALTSMDLLGPLPMTSKGNKYLLVWTDYHTRWIEAVPIPDKEAYTIAKAFHEHVVCRYGAPVVVKFDTPNRSKS